MKTQRVESKKSEKYIPCKHYFLESQCGFINHSRRFKKKRGTFHNDKGLSSSRTCNNKCLYNYKASKCRKQGQVLMLGEQHYILETLNM